MRPKDGENKLHSEAFILSEKIDDSKSKKSDKDIKKEMKRLEKEKMEREKRERKAKEKEKEREKQSKKGKVMCGACGGKCSGEVLRVSDKYFHTACFTCRTCSASLAKGGFFAKDGHYYCPQDYQRAFGTRCAACHQYVEGEVVSALGNTYHQKCFTCARCNRAFPSGEKVTYTGAEVVCSSCVAGPVRQTAREASRSPGEGGDGGDGGDGPEVDEGACAGCGAELAEGQALVALERQWHPGCFACAACGAVLAGEYLGRAGRPYCERDYQRLFGVRCAYCARYIAGKVLQAGDAHHFHPTCARCSKCGDPFGDGEEMFLQGAAIWHPRCGPAPGRDPRDPRDTASDDMQFSLRSRTPSVNGSYCSPYSSLNRKYTWCASPGLTLRSGGVSPARITTYSYLTSEPGYLRRPLQPPPPASPHFHRPAGGEAARPASRARSAMAALVDSMRADTPRARSPGPRPDEPIELAAYPGAHPPAPGTPAPLDRPDFPAPPYAAPPRRAPPDDEPEPAPELERLAASSGLAQALLRAARAPRALDPRNASRTASAAREPPARLRYPSPLGASPSRRADREPDAAPVDAPRAYNVVSSLRAAPRPGYGLAARSHTFSSSTAVDFTFSGLGDKTHSTDFSSGKSDMSAGSVSEAPYGGGGGGARRSLPNMADSLLVHEPAKLYPYHLLLITNYRLPPDVDRLNLERHLSDAEFECILQTQRRDFYRLPQWRRNELKRRARLF